MKQKHHGREMTLVLRTTDHRSEPATAQPALPAGSDPLLQLQHETRPPSGPGAIRSLNHPHELTLAGIPVRCSVCSARRDWMLINHRRNVWVVCRCSNQWLEPEISRADFDELITMPEWVNYPTLQQCLTVHGFDGALAGIYLD
ncbi:hypothetical protein ACFV97_25720 [Streptomyces sp. NPDC059913]|uniref:hypothetical protein n=1 Tax=unclassified Streptomyces TaxID=2593676 RepID=UPI00366664D4